MCCRFELLSLLISFCQTVSERLEAQRESYPSAAAASVTWSYSEKNLTGLSGQINSLGSFPWICARKMIHELLLALSGHPSDLFIEPPPSSTQPDVEVALLPLLSPPERELLSSVGRKAYLHRYIRAAAEKVAESHSSTVCRAVATAITSKHLAQFQQKILDVERNILQKDAGIVGAYNIVPLAGIVAEFDDWTRRLEWLWDLVLYMNQPQTSGASTINRLRDEAKTGYPDIEELALDLGRVADRAWIQQLSSWILYGRPPHGDAAADFFIQAEPDDPQSALEFKMESGLRPCFVSSETASSILFIGKTLNLANQHLTTAGNATRHLGVLKSQLITEYHKYLAVVADNITETALTRMVSKIRQSLSRNLLQQLLPLDHVLDLLNIFEQFFLLGRGEFAAALVEEADEKGKMRKPAEDPSNMRKALKGILIKEGEAEDVLSRTWSHMSSSLLDEDDTVDTARQMLRLTLANPYTEGREAKAAGSGLERSTFHDFLLSVPSYLVIDCPQPLDLFVAPPELETYSHINSYLLALRRAHMHLSNLWRQNRLRRLGGPLADNPVEERSVWATCRSALFFLSETGAYFAGEIVQESWKHFLAWVKQGEHDPEQLSTAHIAFLHALQHYLLLDDNSLTTSLQRFLRHIDATVGILLRLETSPQDVLHDRPESMQELSRSRIRLDSEMKTLMSRLRSIDAERGSAGSVLKAATAGDRLAEKAAFEPKRCGGVDRLLMKLDFGAEMEGEEGFGDRHL